MAKRTDKWSPSNIDWTRLTLVMVIEREFEFDPETSKEHVFAFDYLLDDNLPDDFPIVLSGAEREAINAYFKVTLLSEDRDSSRCGVCGHAVKYGGVLVDVELKEGVMVGNDCLATYNQVSQGYVEAQYEARRLAALARGYARFNAFVADKPELAQAFITGKGHHIIEDIASKLREYGSISQRQIDLVIKIAPEVHAEQVAVAARPEPLDAPDGHVTVIGEILSIKSVDGYGYNQTTTKMLVESVDGWKVWITMPLNLDAARGDVVQFDATLTPSHNDPKFAYGKRPTRAGVLTPTEPA
jgi:hypothetical protein